MIDFLKNFFCLNEERVSIITTVFFTFVVTALYLLFTTHNIPDNLTDLLIWFAGFIIGYNGLQMTRNVNKS